jgi:hypothetical protein
MHPPPHPRTAPGAAGNVTEPLDAAGHGDCGVFSGPYSDCFKYRWIRANRGNLAIEDALRHSDWDADFDAQIEAAIRMSVEGAGTAPAGASERAAAAAKRRA